MLELKKYRVTILKVTQILSSHRAVYAGLAFCHGSESLKMGTFDIYATIALLYMVLAVRG